MLNPRRLALVACTAYLLQVVVQTMLSVHANGGAFSYALDDAYIHLALARNFADTGVLGVVPSVYASATSSPGWTLILTVVARALPQLLRFAPLLLNVAASLALIVVFVRAAELPIVTGRRAFAAVGLAAVLPALLGLPALTLAGMEAVPFCLLVLMSATAEPEAPALPLLVFGASALRPEGTFLAVLFGARAVRQRRWRGAVAIVAAAALPWVLLGAFNLAHGDAFLSNSILAHGTVRRRPGQSTLGWIGSTFASYAASFGPVPAHDPTLVLLGVFAAACFALAIAVARDARLRSLAAAFFTLASLHAVVSTTIAPLGRYQSYLVPVGLLVVVRLLLSAAAPPIGARHTAMALLVLLLGFSHQLRIQLFAHRACHEIETQQGTMARLLRAQFATDVVVVNDIGRVAFDRPGPLVDVCGLGTSTIARLAHDGRFDAPALEAFARGAQATIALVYDRFLPEDAVGPCGTRPHGWRRIGSLVYARPPLVLGDGTVDVYAIDPARADELSARISAFAPQLPPDLALRLDPR